MIKCLPSCLYHLVAINVKKVQEEEEEEEKALKKKKTQNIVSSAQCKTAERDLGQRYPCLVDHTISTAFKNTCGNILFERRLLFTG